MATQTFTYTFTGHEAAGSGLLSGGLPNFSGNWSISATLSSPAVGIYNLSYSFSEAIGSGGCWSDSISFVPGDQTKTANWTVGIPSGSWHCTDWTTFSLGLGGATDIPPGGMQIVIVVTGNFTPLPECQYGTQSNPDATVWTTVTAAAVDIVATLLGVGPVGLLAFDALIGSPLIAYSCNALPPSAPTFGNGDFIGNTGIVTPGSMWKLMDLFRVGVWHFYCQCSPAPSGQPAPVPPVVPNPGPPLTTPGPQPPLPCTGEDMCQVLNIIVRQINSISLNIQYNRYTETQLPGPASSFNYVLGTPHVGLTGDGQFTFAGVVGFLVQITEKPGDTTILPGATAYNWNMGWVAILDQNGALEEHRVARDSYVWLPAGAMHAHTFDWHVNPGVGLTVWELVPGPA